MMMFRPFFHRTACFIAAAVFCAGCARYQRGTISHPQIDSAAVGLFENKTEWPTLGTSLRSKVAEMVMTDGSLVLTGADTADVVIRGKVVNVRFEQLISVKGDDNQLSDYQAEYRGAVYRVTLDVVYEVISPKLGNKVIIPATKAVGQGTYPKTVDMGIGRDEATRQATAAAARQIVAAVTEAW
ncbi:MAG: LPS assembly lipoprotein LptE [Lentisphaeria bacterium]|nr:LPS assembly lipoprotein LptE [Lentisphaeria bacterium]